MTATAATAASPLRVQVLMFDGVEEQDFVAPVEVLGLAGKLSGGAVRTTLVSPDRPRTVTCTYGTEVKVPHGWSPADADVLVVPGGGYTNRTGPGVHRLIGDKAFLRRLAESEALPVGICTGTMILSAAGITRGRNATTHSGAKADLAAQGATVVNARVVDDGDLVTGGGITSGLEVALWLVERFAGAQVAQRAETVLEYERRGTVWRR
ncbi:DJ-1/PfpI family protein [Lentzea sp. NPDC003310]|uniref:DJ-1/PfpI family protein n=1 Tax=Lentzea sp. NPDC003310 TaxID=3154447 RepID=UPI0033AF746E